METLSIRQAVAYINFITAKNVGVLIVWIKFWFSVVFLSLYGKADDFGVTPHFQGRREWQQ